MCPKNPYHFTLPWHEKIRPDAVKHHRAVCLTPAKPASFSEAAGTRESFCFAVLALAELLGAAGLAKANLLTFDFASIASDETWRSKEHS